MKASIHTGWLRLVLAFLSGMLLAAAFPNFNLFWLVWLAPGLMLWTTRGVMAKSGSAQWQHAESALFRAVENGVPLVRCANNGLTCWMDAQGRLHDVYFAGSKNIYQEGYKIVEVPLGANRGRTIYNRYGDWFGWGCGGGGETKIR